MYLSAHVSLDELDKRNEVIRALSKQTKVAELREKDVYRELNSTQQQLQELSCRQMNTTRHEQNLEVKSNLFLDLNFWPISCSHSSIFPHVLSTLFISYYNF